MKKLFLCLITVLICNKIESKTAEKKSWTFLVYMAAANNLNSFAYSDLEEMKKIGSNECVNILVYMTVQKQGEKKVTRQYYVTKDGLEQCGEDRCMDSGDKFTLMDALRWAHEDFPSEYFALDMWDHGSGPLNRSMSKECYRGICYDDDTGHYLTDLDYQYALKKTCERYRGGKKLDIVSCDACLMANVEVAYALEPYACYFVSSQETIPGDGYDYARVFEKLQYGTMKPEAFARTMVEAYDKTYESKSNYTLSVMDLKHIAALAENIDTLGWLMHNALKKEDKEALTSVVWESVSRRNCTHFEEATYIDLYEFYSNLLKRVHDMHLSLSARLTITSTLMMGLRHINKCILENVHSENYNTVHGISIYFPYLLREVDESYLHLYWSQKTHWLSFLKTYLQSRFS